MVLLDLSEISAQAWLSFFSTSMVGGIARETLPSREQRIGKVGCWVSREGLVLCRCGREACGEQRSENMKIKTIPPATDVKINVRAKLLNYIVKDKKACYAWGELLCF